MVMKYQSRRDKARLMVNGQDEHKAVKQPTQKVEQNHQLAAPQDGAMMDIDKAQQTLSQPELLNKLVSIDRFVGRTYLNSIETSAIIPLKKTIVKNGKSVEVFNMPGEPENLPSFRWFRIDKIVYDKNVFFADKFSMLFNALHSEAAQVALVLDKKHGVTRLYLGARDNNDKAYNLSGQTLEAAINGFLTGVQSTIVDNNDVKNLTNQYASSAVACVSGVASLRDDKKEKFVQGLERLINSTTSIPSYSAFFIADSVTEAERVDIVNAFQQIYRQLSPFEEFQTSLSKSETTTLTDTITEGITNTIGKTIGRTITNGTTYTTTNTKTEGKSVTDGTSCGWSYSESKGESANFTPFGIGGSDNWNESEGYNEQENHSETKLSQLSEAVSKGDLHQVSDLTQQLVQDAKMKQTAQAKTSGTSQSKTLQVTTKDLHVKDLMNTIETQIKRLRNAAPFGLWNCATYFLSDSESTSREIANIYKGTIVGEESGFEISALNSWDESSPINAEVVKYLSYGINPRFIVDGQNVSAGTTVSSKELAIHMALPQCSVPGIVVQTKASFGRNVTRHSSLRLKEDDEDYNSGEAKIDVLAKDNNARFLKLGNVLHLGEIDTKNDVCLDLDDLTRHTFVTGTTGSGKSNAMFIILKSLYDAQKKFMVIEPKKGEYKKILGGLDNVSVYGTNPYKSKLLTINPFSFDYKKIMVYQHVNQLVEIFNACWPMYAAMPAVLKKSILDAYKACGWNTKLSKPLDINNVLFPTIEDVIIALRKYINSSEYSADSKSDYKGAIETRLLDLTEGMTGLMLNSGFEISNSDLFDSNAIIDLHEIGNSETISLIMGMLILKLNEYRMSGCGMNEHLSHVTVLEEAHNILKRTSTSQNQESSNLIGKSVEMLNNSIAEMRTYGEGFIIVDQSPSQVDMSAIRNTNTKIILALPDEDDCRVVGKSIGLSDEQIDEINKQKVGQAIVYQNDWEEPVQCSIDQFKASYPSTEQPDIKILDDSYEYHVSIDLIKFLVAGRLNVGPKFNLSRVINDISNANVPSTLKFAVCKMVKEFNETGTCKIWHDHYFRELSELVSSFIDKNDEIKAIMLQTSQLGSNELTNSIADVLVDDLGGLTKGEICTVIQCLMRYQSTQSVEMLKIYDSWKNN